MKATAILFILAAIWIVVNAANLRDVLQGKLHFSFQSKPTPQLGKT